MAATFPLLAVRGIAKADASCVVRLAPGASFRAAKPKTQDEEGVSRG